MISIAGRLAAWLGLVAALGAPATAAGQQVEAAGTRALGMAGAFVAVADDSSATWWNPAGLADGPFVDMALARSAVDSGAARPAGRGRVTAWSLGTPPLGLSYYRLRIANVGDAASTAAGGADREDGGAEAALRSLSISQFGVTLLQTVVPGVHVGTTLKYLRVSPAQELVDGTGLDTGALLDRGDALDGEAGGHFDLDAGILAVAGPLRIGGVARQLRAVDAGGQRLPRHVRAGVAYDAEAAGLAPLMLALDVDLRRYDAGTGDRRVVALGGEQWWSARRLAVRGGVRVNTVGAEERTVTAGVSVAPRPGVFIDGYVAGGGESGWGIAARASF